MTVHTCVTGCLPDFLWSIYGQGLRVRKSVIIVNLIVHRINTRGITKFNVVINQLTNKGVFSNEQQTTIFLFYKFALFLFFFFVKIM